MRTTFLTRLGVVALAGALSLAGPVSSARAETFVLASAQVVTSTTGQPTLVFKASGPIAFAVITAAEVGAVEDGALRVRLYGVEPGALAAPGGLAPFGVAVQAVPGGTVLTVRAAVGEGQQLQVRSGGSVAELEFRVGPARP